MKFSLCFFIFSALTVSGAFADIDICPTCSNIQQPCSCNQDEEMLKNYNSKKICCSLKKWSKPSPHFQILEQTISEPGIVTDIKSCPSCMIVAQHCRCPSYDLLTMNKFHDLCCTPRPWISFNGLKY